MRLRIRHKIQQRFETPARNVTRILRLTPRSHEGQHVINWRIDVDTDCVLKVGEDGFGNITHTFTAKGPCDDLAITVAGEIDNFDAAGVVRGAAERMPRELYLRETALTTADAPIRQFAREATASEETVLGRLHALQDTLHDLLAFEAAAVPGENAEKAFAAKKGCGSDIAHVFVAAARTIGIPARVTSGYYLCDDKKTGLVHVWAEGYVEGLGWTGFDAAHKVCPQENHVRLAMGLDVLAAAPVRGVGGETETHDLDMVAPFSLGWVQSQRQGPGGQSQNQGGQSQSQGSGGQMQSQGGQSQG
jgi:transglutaminase-like putative cysteine protease